MNASEAIVGIVFYGGLFWFLLSHWKSRPVVRPSYKSAAYKSEFARVRPLVLARDGYRCARCGAATSVLHVHHRRPRSEGGSNSPANLITLCPYHHQMIHGRRF